MKKIFSLLFFIAIIGNNYGQSILDSYLNVNSNKIQSKSILNISGSIESNNYFVSGTTLDLLFTLKALSPDEEYFDQIIMTFPEGVVPNSADNPFPGNTNTSTTPEALNINGQIVTWGDNDNSFGGITAPGEYSFHVNVTIDSSVTNKIGVSYSVSGDQYKGTIHDFSDSVFIKELPATAQLETNIEGSLARLYQIPLEQATFIPSANITNIGNNLVDTILFYANTNTGYNDSITINTPINTSETKSFNFSEFSATSKGDVTFSFSNNYSEDSNPTVKPLEKTIQINNTLARDNGHITGHIGVGNGSEIGQIFEIKKQDTLTSVIFNLGANSSIGDEISVSIRSFNGVPGANIGSSFPLQIVEDTIYQVNVFPEVVLKPGLYFIGVVEGKNNVGLAVTSTPFVAHTAWGFLNNKWNDLGDLGYEHTYKLRAVFDDYKEVNNDIQLVSIDTKDGYAQGNINIEGTVRNLSNINNLNSFDVEYSIDGGTSVKHSVTGISLAPGMSYDFKHSTPYNATITGEHDIIISISNPNGNTDENLDNNSISKSFKIVNEIFTRVVVGEEATGTWCGWCVRGHVGLKDMEHNHSTDKWIGIAVHNEDPMADSEYDGKISSMVSGYPSGVINRSIISDPGEFEETFQELKNDIPSAKVEISSAFMIKETRKITAKVSTIAALDLNNINYRLSMIVVENGVTGSTNGFAQVNYYSYYNRPIEDWEGIDWSKLGNPIPASNMVYNHVGRYIVGGWDGINGSVPSSLKYNERNNYTFTSTLPTIYDEKNIKLVFLILDNSTGEIINASEINLDVFNDAVTSSDQNEINIYPNPTTDLITINASKGSKINIYNTNGQVVLNSIMDKSSKTINLSNLDKGSYFVEIFDDKKVYSKKIVLIK